MKLGCGAASSFQSHFRINEMTAALQKVRAQNFALSAVLHCSTQVGPTGGVESYLDIH
jgi:hypothetical protein